MVTKKRPSSYTVSYSCSNCDWSGSQTFDRGKPAPATLECPKCGCQTASRGWRMSPTLPWRPRPSPVIPINPWLPKRPFDPWRPVKPWQPWRPYPMDPCDPPWPWDRPIYELPPYIPTKATDNTRDDDWPSERGGPARNAGRDEQREQRSLTKCTFCWALGGQHEPYCQSYMTRPIL